MSEKKEFMSEDISQNITFEDEDETKFWIKLKHGDNKVL